MGKKQGAKHCISTFFFFLHLCTQRVEQNNILFAYVCLEGIVGGDAELEIAVPPVGKLEGWERRREGREGIYLKIFFNVLFIDSEMHSSQGHSSVSFDKHIQACNQPPAQLR